MTKQDLFNLYSSDPEFVSTYHGNTNWSIEDCTNDSWEAIKDLELHITDYGYIAINRNDLIDRLAGFFIAPAYRNKEIKGIFFSDIKKLLPNRFITSIHSSNIKCIRFLSSVGKITKSDNITTHIVFNWEK